MSNFLNRIAQNMIARHGDNIKLVCESLDAIEPTDESDYSHILKQSECRVEINGQNWDLNLGNQETKINLNPDLFQK
jgi:hypothetical protein